MAKEQQHQIKIHDWDKEGSEKLRNSKLHLLDTTLRDGVQTPGIRQLSFGEKIKIIDFDARIGIEEIDLCLPADRKSRYFQEGVACAQYIRENHPQIDVVVLTPTREENVEATLDFASAAKTKVSSILFRGSSDLRLLAEDWHEDDVIKDMYRFTKILSSNGHRVISATEDSTRTRPEFLREIFLAGKEGGATEFCLADTVGYADPAGIATQVRWLKKLLGDEKFRIHFHGHNDTGNAVSNTIAALKAGAHTGHITWLGVGERTGNAPLEGVLSDLHRRGLDRYDLSSLMEGAKLVAQAFEVEIPRNHPLVGEVVFTTESGIHVSAMHKSRQKKLNGIGGIVYSAVNPRDVGREHRVEIGPQGGTHSVQWVLEEMEIPYSDSLRDGLLFHARALNRTLTRREVVEFVNEIKIRELNGFKNREASV